MAGLHNTPEGPKPCYANLRPCPLRTAEGETVPHFATRKEAEEAYEKHMAETVGLMPQVQRPKMLPPKEKVLQALANKALSPEEVVAALKSAGPTWPREAEARKPFEDDPSLIGKYAEAFDADTKSFLAGNLAHEEAVQEVARSLNKTNSNEDFDRDQAAAIYMVRDPKFSPEVKAIALERSVVARRYQRVAELAAQGARGLQYTKLPQPTRGVQKIYKFDQQAVQAEGLDARDIDAFVRYHEQDHLFNASYDHTTGEYRGFIS